KLHDMLGLTIVMVTHDLVSIYDTLDKIAIIENKKIAFEGTLAEVTKVESPFIKTFFNKEERL
ncbi:MAG: ABC transporter ATP-binding protein, partial [Sulfurimonas sp.]